MRISRDITSRYWHEAAIADLASKYAAQGYDVKKDARIGSNEADLVVKKGDELIVLEVKSGAWTKDRAAEVQKLRNEVVHKLGGKFTLVLASPPSEKSIEIDGIDGILLRLLSEDIGELDELSAHTIVEDISDVEINSVCIHKNRIEIQGSAVVSAELKWGSSSDDQNGDGARVTESFPVDFDVALDGNLEVLEVVRLSVDTSSYYD